MTLTNYDLAMVVAYFLLMLMLAYFTRRSKSFQDFAVGKHSIPALLVFASLATTIVGPGFSIGFASKGWQTGYLYYFLVLAYAVQVVAVGLWLAPRLSRNRDCMTLGDVMRKKYGRFAQLLTGITSVGVCIGFSAVMGKVGGGTLHAVTGLSFGLSVFLVTGTTALITFSGGLRATIATEGAQFALKSVVTSVLVLLVVLKAPDSIASVSTLALDLTRAGAGALSKWGIVGIVLSFMLGEALIPPYANRALSAKSAADSKVGFVLAGLFCIAWLGMVSFMGVAARDILPTSTSPDDVFVLTGQAVLPAGLFGLLLAAIIAIVMSSQESVLNAGAVSFSRDIVGLAGHLSDRAVLSLAKVMTLIFAGASIYAAQYAPSIIDGLLIMYSIWAPTILVPLIGALFMDNPKSLSGWLSMLVGGISSIVWQSLLLNPFQVPAILVGLTAAGIAFAAGQLIGQAAEDQQQGEVA